MRKRRGIGSRVRPLGLGLEQLEDRRLLAGGLGLISIPVVEVDVVGQVAVHTPLVTVSASTGNSAPIAIGSQTGAVNATTVLHDSSAVVVANAGIVSPVALTIGDPQGNPVSPVASLDSKGLEVRFSAGVQDSSESVVPQSTITLTVVPPTNTTPTTPPSTVTVPTTNGGTVNVSTGAKDGGNIVISTTTKDSSPPIVVPSGNVTTPVSTGGSQGNVSNTNPTVVPFLGGAISSADTAGILTFSNLPRFNSTLPESSTQAELVDNSGANGISVFTSGLLVGKAPKELTSTTSVVDSSVTEDDDQDTALGMDLEQGAMDPEQWEAQGAGVLDQFMPFDPQDVSMQSFFSMLESGGENLVGFAARMGLWPWLMVGTGLALATYKVTRPWRKSKEADGEDGEDSTLFAAWPCAGFAEGS